MSQPSSPPRLNFLLFSTSSFHFSSLTWFLKHKAHFYLRACSLQLEHHSFIQDFPRGLGGKESACNPGDLCSIPGLGRSPGEGNGNPLQYSCLENPVERGAWWATVMGLQRVRHDQHFHLFPPFISIVFSVSFFRFSLGVT